MKKDVSGSAFVILAGIFWGMMTIFVRALKNDYGLSPLQISTIRFTVGTLFLAAFMLFYNKEQFKIKLKDIYIFVIMGMVSCFCMGYFYFAAVVLIPVSMASVIMYTAPFWVLIVAVIFFKEKLTILKIVALIMGFAGCVLVSGFGGGDIKTIGIIYSLFSSFAYASYSILGKIATEKYKPLTVTLYSYIFASICAIAICNPIKTTTDIASVIDVRMVLLMIGLGVITISIPFSLYTIGLSKIPAGKAAILSLTEPMVTTIVGAVVFSEFLGFLGYIGVAAIIVAIILINMKQKA